jgi:23S rRNA pseudouridine2605 synthase
MKKELKSKANSGAKSPAAKRTPKIAAKSTTTTDKSKSAGASKITAVSKVAVVSKAPSVKAKTATVKAKTKATKAKPAEKLEAKRKKPATESKTPAAKAIPTPRTGKRAAKAEEAIVRAGEPVLDPIGDVTSGEARRYLAEAEDSGRAEMSAHRAAAETEAADGTVDAGPGMAAASGANEAGNSAEGEGTEEGAGVVARPPAKLERLQKILSQAGIASRRHAEEMIVAGRVMVNGQVVTQLGSKADAGRDHIRVDGKLLKGAERHRYFVLNKPKGYVTTVSDPEGRPTVMEFFAKTNERLYPVGRLDYQSEGLLLMTNDGELANLVTKAGSGVEKTYLVKVAGQPSEEELDRLRRGVAIERGEAGSERVRTAPARIRQVRVGDNPWYEVVLTEGRNRELRKMFAAIGHFAEKIRRVGYGPLELDVEPGKLRELTADEVNALRLTAEGKMKARAMRVTLPKDARRAPGKWGGKAWDRGTKPPLRAEIARRGPRQGTREQGSRGAGDRGPERYAGKPGGFAGQQREERGPRTEWKPRERTFGGGSGSGAARSGDRGGVRKEWKPREGAAGGRSEGKPFRREEKTGFGARGSRPPRTNSGFDKRGGKPFGARPAFGGSREGGAGRTGERAGERKEWKPREGAAGRFGSAPRKPFRQQGERPAFVRPEGSFKPGDGPKKRFDSGRGTGAGKSFGSGRRTGSKERWVPRPNRPRNEEGRGQTGTGERPAPPSGEKRWERSGAAAGMERPKPPIGARPGGFKRPVKPGGFQRPGGFSKPGRPGGGASRSGPRFGGKRPEGR